jgi:tetratricopeptide (TPR) repeat protein
MKTEVKFWTEDVVIPTYMPDFPDKHPMFLEKRVYQGSSGKIYPLPFTDRISVSKTDRKWKAIFIENRYLKVMILPEIGGRIHAIFDKSNNYDLIYKQEVIKPALVGLAGSWISGGIEFNWAQHHRPATFLPVDFTFEEHADGAKTVWLGDHEPMSRMKGMHGVCLSPDSAYVELKVRVTNRTPFTQTFLWWANAATKVHEGYQSFFPPDVTYIADHAKRAMSKYPHCNGFYYGVNYAERAAKGVSQSEFPAKFVPPHCGKPNPKIPDYSPDDLSWYANIPVPTSYMCMNSQEDFFGGYDHLAEAGIVHIADRHISPGKKQWTWGNHDFGYAWDRNLSDDEAPYIELMSGVFTDNQPDFSFLKPWETKTWSQYWFGIGKIGVPQKANINAAISLKVSKIVKIGVSVTREFEKVRICLNYGENSKEWTANISPEKPFLVEIPNENKFSETEFLLKIFDSNGVEIISYQPKLQTETEVPEAAREPFLPEEIESVEELFLTGFHLEQYRHATRKPEDYWLEALKRDPLDSRCNNALGLLHLRRGEFESAEKYFRNAVERLTKLNPNPADGEAFYNLGLSLRFQNEQNFTEAYAAFYKANWNQACATAAFFALAEMDCRKNDWHKAIYHLEKSIDFNQQNLSAKCLKALALRKIGQQNEAEKLLEENIQTDALDWWSIYLLKGEIGCDKQTVLDIVHNFANAGFYEEAIGLIKANLVNKNSDLATQNLGTLPLIFYTLGWLYVKVGEREKAVELFEKAANENSDYCFPNRLEEIEILETAMRENSSDSLAPYYLGNLFYDRKRYAEAIELWEQSAELNNGFSIVWRNLGIAYFNFEKNPEKALQAYEKAFSSDRNARLLFERDQLWKRVGKSAEIRLQELEKSPDLINLRDDLTVEICSIYNQLNQPEKALHFLENRHFQPWEGGEGQVLQQFVTANILLGRKFLSKNKVADALKHFAMCLNPPKNLSETHHFLANKSDIFYWLGIAEEKSENIEKAFKYWTISADAKGDFQEMSVTEFSEMSFFSALSLLKLGKSVESEKLLNDLLNYANYLEKTEAKIDYFATSLPTMLLFDDDIQKRQETKAMFLQAQAFYGLGEREKSTKLIEKVLVNDSNHQLALTISDIEI